MIKKYDNIEDFEKEYSKYDFDVVEFICSYKEKINSGYILIIETNKLESSEINDIFNFFENSFDENMIISIKNATTRAHELVIAINCF